jgi:hypothetical protein
MMSQCSIGRLPIYLSPCTKWRCRGLDDIGGTAVSDHVDLARVLAHSGAGAPSSSVSWSGSNGVGIIVRTSQCANGGEGLKNLESPQFMHHDRLNVCILCDRNPGRRYSGPRERKISAGKKLRGLCGSSPATGGPLSNRGHLSLHSNQYHEEAFVLTVFLVAACFTKLFLPPL